MKAFLMSFAVLVSLATPSRANDHAQLQTFAACAGRLSAVMEYQWMFDGDASERTKIQRRAVLDLISAIMEPDMGRQVLHWRLTAKQAHNVLLTRATFNQDAGDANWAREQATLYERECTGLLLS